MSPPIAGSPFPDCEEAGTFAHVPKNESIPTDHKTELQTIWEDTMKGVGGVGLPHRKCAVLLLSWGSDDDDLKTEQEVDELEKVFKDIYGYEVKKEKLGGKKSPQVQAHKYLSDFVFDHDDDEENTLLIVYYAGHGVPLKPDGVVPGGMGLSLIGKRKPNDKTKEMNSIIWGKAETIIKPARGDVLVIFDCCYAGILAKDKRSVSDRNFEFLAACGATALTDIPGNTSFTSALIWSLKKLAKSKKGFTTQELLNKINRDAPDFPSNQDAQIIERGEEETRSFRKLVLAPSLKHGEELPPETPIAKPKPAGQIKHYFDLRFFYEHPPTKKEILELSRTLKDMIEDEKIGARSIGWLKMTDIMRHAAEKFLRMAARKSEASLKKSEFTGAGIVRPHSVSFPVTPPLSDTGFPELSPDNTPQKKTVENIETSNVGTVQTSNVGTVESVTISNIESLTVDTSNISSARLRTIIMGGPDYRYRMKIFVVGLVVLLLECFHRLRPQEAPIIVLLAFCGYAWHMSNMYHKNADVGSGFSSYLPLLIGAISLFICGKLLMT